MQVLCLLVLIILTETRSEYIVRRSTVEDVLIFKEDFQNSSTCDAYNAVVKSSNTCSCSSKNTFFSLSGKKASCISGILLTGCFVAAKSSPSSIPVVQLNISEQFELLNTLQCNQYPLTQLSLKRWKNGADFLDVTGVNSLFFKLARIGTQYEYSLLVSESLFSQEFAGALLQLRMNLCSLSACFMFKIEGQDKWSINEELVSSITVEPAAATTKLLEKFTSSVKIDASLIADPNAPSPSVGTVSVSSIVSSLNDLFNSSSSEYLTQSNSMEPNIHLATFKLTSTYIRDGFSMIPSSILRSDLVNSSTLNILSTSTIAPNSIPSSTDFGNLKASTLIGDNFSIPSLIQKSTNIQISYLLNFSALNILSSSTVTTNSIPSSLGFGSSNSSNSIVIGVAVTVFVVGFFFIVFAIFLARRQHRSTGEFQPGEDLCPHEANSNAPEVNIYEEPVPDNHNFPPTENQLNEKEIPEVFNRPKVQQNFYHFNS